MSQYRFSGRLGGYVCDDCMEPWAFVTVLLYRHGDGQNIDDLVGANPKTTFAVHSDEDIKQKQSRLIATTKTDGDGNFTFNLNDDEHQYNGGPFEVDVRLTSIPGANQETEAGPVQFTLTSLQPDWRQEGDLFVAPFWDYCLSARYWCHIIGLYGLWVICGRVISAKSGLPLDTMTVRAFDRDWLQDDALGTDVTDTNGHFRIYYTSATFKETPFPLINVELTSGPDVYFQVETSGGNVVLDEAPSRGRQPDRENVGRCFCVTLRVDTEPEPPYDDPLFTNVGYFHILSDIDASGKCNKAKTGAGGVGFGFRGHTKLKGFCPKVKPDTTDEMYYRFLYIDPVTSVETPVTGDKLTAVIVGSRLIFWDVNSDGIFGYTFQDIIVAGTGATAPLAPGGSGPLPAHVIVPDGQGWIKVDQEGLDDGFYGPLVRLNTNKIVPGGSAPGSGAGTAPADPKNGAVVTVIFETTTDPSDATKTERQSDTATLLVNNWNEVRELALQEFQAGTSGGCTELTTQVTIEYTADHEVIASWSLSMISAASSQGWTAPALPGGTTPRGGVGTEVLDISDPVAWPPCSYTVRLHSRLAVTDGETNDAGSHIPVTFCKA